MMLKVVLVDDEILALNLLEAILIEIGDIEIVGKFLNPIEGLEQIQKLKPDLVFLDIEMPEMTGMGVAEKINSSDTDIVFVTAYDHYALEAFNVQAVDYVLKPIEKARLKKTIERILQRRNVQSALGTEIEVLYARLLGDFQLRDIYNKPIKWRTKKVKELCAYLIHHNEPVHRDAIMEDLWPQYSSDKASALLHTTIYQLRKKFKDIGIENPIRFLDERYRLTVDIFTDVDELQNLQASGNIERLIDFYKDDYLSEDSYPWSMHKRENLHKEFLHYLDSFVFSANIDTRKQDIYRRVIEKLCELEPWEERYAMELVKYYISKGKYKEAKDSFNGYKTSLKQELGVEPRKEFAQLMD